MSRGFLWNAVAMVVSTAFAPACSQRENPKPNSSSSTSLRVGVAQLVRGNPVVGLRQLGQILAVEGLARPSEDGRMQPSLAEGWTRNPNGRSLSVQLRHNVKFHDGSSLDAPTVATVLSEVLKGFMGPVFSDVDYVRAPRADVIEIGFKEASPLLLEAIEAPIQKLGQRQIGTGAFMVSESATELRANPTYYLGRPIIDRVTVTPYSSVRSAWAEMLRGKLDMLYEVGTDALDSLKASSTVSTFTYTRHYQYVIALNSEAPVLRSREVRQALNGAIDREAVVRSGLNNHGIASSGPLPPRHWTLDRISMKREPDPRLASELVRRSAQVRFTCLVSPDSLDERIALEAKRQLAPLGIEMSLEEASRAEIVRRAEHRQYEAIVTEAISGPSLFRLYGMWHSGGVTNWGNFGNKTIDDAFDGIRHVDSEDQYRAAVIKLHHAFLDDPPAIFLAWSVLTRAVSNRFEIPTVEPGRDVLSNLRLWKPVDEKQANQN
jgi:peptide/nickel transport system substrate-binding protein